MAQIAIGQYSLETLLDTVVSVGLLKFDVDPSVVSFVRYRILYLILDIDNEPFLLFTSFLRVRSNSFNNNQIILLSQRLIDHAAYAKS